MIPQGLIAQVAMIILSVGIAFWYLKPTVEQVRVDQDVIARYETELQNVTAVNAKLDDLIRRSKEFTEADRGRLRTYLPFEVDSVAVQRDLLALFNEADIELTSLSAGEGGGVTASPAEGEMMVGGGTLIPHTFVTTFSASYEDLKDLLLLIEENHYPLHVTTLSVTAGGEGDEGVAPSGDLGIDLTLTTYSLSMNEAIGGAGEETIDDSM